MNWKDIWLRLRALLLRSRVERELDEEIGFHLEMEVRRNIQSGMDPEEARRRARMRFGRESEVKESCREERRVNLIETFLQDSRYAFRGFRRAPLFALTVIATIGLGLGVNTAAFTIFDSYVLRPLSIADPHSLYQLKWLNRAGRGHGFSWAQFSAVRANNPVIAEMFAAAWLPARVEGQQLFGQLVTANYFRMLGITPAMGRTLRREESEIPGRGAVVVLSFTCWRNRFAGDPNILGKKLLVRGYPLEVVGVAREGFDGIEEMPIDFWTPLSMYAQIQPGQDLFGTAGPEVLTMIARLTPGVKLRQAEAFWSAWVQRAAEGRTDPDKPVSAFMQPRASRIYMSRQDLLLLTPVFVAFILVLLIACANVANMMLARAIARQREIGIRLSLGGARLRIIRQLLTESILLALPGAIAGFLLSLAIVEIGRRLMYATLPSEFLEDVRVPSLSPDIRVFLFMLAAAAISGLLFGITPALQAARTDVVKSWCGFSGDTRRQRLRNSLAVAQVAVCVLLMVCAGILLQGANRVNALDCGMRTQDVVALQIDDGSRARVLAALTLQPLVQARAGSSIIPLDGGFPSARLSGDGVHFEDSSYNNVSPDYFKVLDIAVVRGRNFSTDEAVSGAPVAIVSEALARQLWGRNGAIDQVLRFAPDPRSRLSIGRRIRYPLAKVIGVARDVNAGIIDNDLSRRMVYLPADERTRGSVLLLRVNGNPELARQSIDRALMTAAPGGVERINRLQQFLAGRAYPFRVASWIAAVLGLVALLLTVSGIYGVLSYLVEQRVRDIGIRMALGATLGSVIRLVLSQSLRLAAAGIAIGALLAMAASRLLASLLIMMNAWDAAAYAGAMLIAASACVLASCLPSWRATRVDPMRTLRHD